MIRITALITLLTLQSACSAQQEPEPPQQVDAFEQMQKEMEAMHKRLFEQFKNAPKYDGDSTFRFRIDTTITGDGFSGTFRFSPFGEAPDSIMMRDMDRIFKEFFGESDPFGRFDRELRRDRGDEMPENDAESDLLPEERLRREEKEGSRTEPQPETSPAPEPVEKKKKLKTTRI